MQLCYISMNKKNAFQEDEEKKKLTFTFVVVMLPDRVQSGLRAQILMWLLFLFFLSVCCAVFFY